MAVNFRVYLTPIPLMLLTYYLLFSGKKTTRRNDTHRGRQAGSTGSTFKPECPSNFHLIHGTCVRCPRGEFSFQGWIACLQWLDCHSIALDVRIRRRIGIPGHLNAVKEIYLADWHGYDVVYSRCASDVYYEDCLHGMKMVEGLQGSEFVVQLIGICYSENLEVNMDYSLKQAGPFPCFFLSVCLSVCLSFFAPGMVSITYSFVEIIHRKRGS